jgi:hypothetical protein
MLLMSLASSPQAGLTDSILFVTRARITGDFTRIASTFGNKKATPGSYGHGGDLYVRYPDGAIKNLTRAGGYGVWGSQATNGKAVRQSSNIARYAGSNIVLTAQAMEVSRAGSPDESVTVRDTSGTNGSAARFLRINSTRP